MIRRAALPCLILLPAASLGSCAAERPTPAPLHVNTGPDGDRSCWVEAEGIRTSLDDLPKRARAWRGRKVIVDAGLEAPYRCVGGTIFTIQSAGVRDVSFISELPK